MGKSKGGKKGKGKGKGGPKEKKLPKVLDGLKPAEMGRPALLGFILRLQAEEEREREERNYFMLERQKFYQMWNLLMEQIALEKEKAALFDAHLQDVEKMKEGEDDLYNSKLRFLKQEHTRKIGDIRLHHLALMKHIQDDNWAIQLLMREGLMDKRKEMRQAQLAFYQIIRGLHWKHAKDVSDLRTEFAHEIRRLETAFDRRLFEHNDKKEEEQEKQIALLANTKNNQINGLTESHHHTTEELSNYFQDLIRHNLGLICKMKETAAKEKTLEIRARKNCEDTKIEYEAFMATPLEWKSSMERWAIEHADDDVVAIGAELKEVTEERKQLKYTLRMVECSNETLMLRTTIANKEKDALTKEFGRTIIEIQKRGSMSRFVKEIAKKAAKREGDLYEALADNVEKTAEDETNYYESLLSPREKDLDYIKTETTEFATEHKNVEDNYTEVFAKNEIHLADRGYPIKKTGVKARGNEEDLLADATTDIRSSKVKKRSTNVKGSKRSLGRGGRSSRKSGRSPATSRTSQRRTVM